MTGYPPNRLYRTRVLHVAPLSPHLTRVTLTAPELAHFSPAGLDQRIKLLLPAAKPMPDIALFERPVAEWYPDWRALPTSQRGAMRTYTARRIRTAEQQLDIDFVLHGTSGPASAWAARAAVGDELLLIGPDRRSAGSGGGIDWHPGDARRVLLAGDETAAPAIGAILEALGASTEWTGHAFIEVPAAGDVLDLTAPPGVAVSWLPRHGRPHGGPLGRAVRSWGAAEPGFAADGYAWLAGESGIVTALRRHLVRGLGVPRQSVSFMGYWRQGAAEQN